MQYDAFLLIWPNAKQSLNYAIRFFNDQAIDHTVHQVRVDENLFNELYDINNRLLRTKKRQCGEGIAHLITYTAGSGKNRFRPTTSEIKICNTLSFDLKFTLRVIEGKNLVHGSTDYNEFQTDIAIIMKYVTSEKMDSSMRYAMTYVNKIFIKSVASRIRGRVVYHVQKTIGYSRFFAYFLRYFFGARERPISISKWRWGSGYFVIQSDQKYFAKIPNRFEQKINEEERIAKILSDYMSFESVETTLIWNNKAIMKPWKDFERLSLSDISDQEVITRLEELLTAISDAMIIHRDLNLHNFVKDPIDNRCYIIDFGLSHIIKDVVTQKSLKFTSYNTRWNDGWLLLVDIIQRYPNFMFEYYNVYIRIAQIAGKSYYNELEKTIYHDEDI